MEQQSWDDGGTKNILPLERGKATFDVKRMMGILDGDPKATFQRKWIQGAHDEVAEGRGLAPVGDDTFIPDVEVHSEGTREDNIVESLTHFMDIHWEHLNNGYRPKGQDMTFMSAAKFGKTGPLSLHYGVFMSTLRSQTSEEQKEWWLGRAQKLGLIGCYAQTELGHGSNVRGLQTTATFDPNGANGDGEWVMHTPTLQAMKWWSTGMYSSTHAAVYAQMILNGKPMGVHVFFVQMRGPDLKPLPGIEMGDIGAKLGDNDATIGYLRMTHVRIPRRHLMEKRSHVTPDGAYVQGPPSASMNPPSGEKKAGAPKKKAAGGGKGKGHYITMLKTRVALTNTAGASLAKACVIASRYSAVRHQGFKNTSAGTVHTSPENQILDYQVQLYRVLRWTSAAYAIKFVAKWLLERRKQAEKSDEGDADLPEIHASAAGLKAYGCVLAADGIEDLRRACGGHGYMMSSGIAPLEADFKGPNTTAEGDYVILSLQTARFLVRAVDTAREGLVEDLPGLTSCLAPLADKNFDPVKDGKPAPVRTLDELLWNGDKSRHYLLSLFQYRTMVACYKANRALRHSIEVEKLSVDQARNNNARLLYTTSIAHVKYFMLNKFVESVDAIPDSEAEDGCKFALHKLVLMFALQDILNGEGWIGLLSSDEMSLVDSSITTLCASLRNDVIALTDAFDFSDRVLNSALGRSDGRVYEALYHAAKNSALNVDSNGNAMIDNNGPAPPLFNAVAKYIDTDFLQDGVNKDATPPRLSPSVVKAKM